MERPDTDQSWRLTPREQLFDPPKREAGKKYPPSVNVSDTIMGDLAAGRTVDEGTLLAFCHILAESVLGNEERPLAGYSDLMSSLHADYAYYDADSHLEGFSEGMVYGATRLAEMMVEVLSERGESFLPPSVLLHPDVLLASTAGHSMDAERLAERLSIGTDDVIGAVIDLTTERIVVCSIMGRRRFYFPSRQGERYARRLAEMATRALDATDGDVGEATGRLMTLADFADAEAVRRAVTLVAEQEEEEQARRKESATDLAEYLRRIWVPEWIRERDDAEGKPEA